MESFFINPSVLKGLIIPHTKLLKQNIKLKKYLDT